MPFQSQNLKITWFHTPNHANGYCCFSYRFLNAESDLVGIFFPDRHSFTNHMNVGAPLSSEPITILANFLESLLAVTSLVYFSNILCQKKHIHIN